MSTDQALPKPSDFDEVPEEARPRELFFLSTVDLDVQGFTEKGYKPVAICTFPTTTEAEYERYHRCLMRGTIEGTIRLSKVQADSLETDLKAHDRFGTKKFTHDKGKAKASSAMKEAFAWRETRHSLAESTAIDPREAIDLINKIRALTPEQIEALTKKSTRVKESSQCQTNT